MSENLDAQVLKRLWDTSFLISEIRKLSKEIDDCYLPSIQSHHIIDDIQKHRSTKLFERYQSSSNGILKYNDVDSNLQISNFSAIKCFSEIREWQKGAARISESDNALYDEMICEKKHRRKKVKKQKPSEDSRWLDPSNHYEVEEEIRRQREKFYEDKGWMVKEKQSHKKYRKIWKTMIKKELGKAARQRTALRKERNVILRKAARDCSRYCRQRALASQKCAKDALNRGRRLAREISMCWRQLEKEEKTSRKKADKILTEQKRKNLEMLDAKRQQRKLNYLITQTELYTHFMSRKMSKEDTDEVDEKAWSILGKIEEDNDDKNEPMFDIDKAMADVKEAVNKQAQQIQSFTSNKDAINDGTTNGETSPSLFQGELKSYQKKGVEWLLYLFEQGINGILADEMGLGKTIQTIAFLATLAEKYDLWGPFLIVAPASTVHNWTQEFHRFLPAFRVVPYWGSVGERKILRRFWNSGSNLKQQVDVDCNNSILLSDSSFHVVVSSYQVVLQDAKMVGRVRWQYLVLDEAHAIKNTSSQRWNTLLSFECRNRLLLTGTPIQNTMQELWALLHFIMPTLFDSHEEFNDWFSRDIESQASAAAQGAATSSKHTANLTTTKLNATQLSRLHLILQPFMLRRVKTEVEHELPDKIEKMLQCRLSSRQAAFYYRLKRRIRIDDLNIDLISRQQKSLLNLVMQLRKVCNHPDLVESRVEQFSLSTRFLDPYFKWPRLLTSLDSPYKPLSSIATLLTIFHPYFIHELTKSGSNSTFAFLPFFHIQPDHLYQYMIGTNKTHLLLDRSRHMELLAWHTCYQDHKQPYVMLKSLFYTNVTYHVLQLFQHNYAIDLLFPSGCYSILDWNIIGNNAATSDVLKSMPTSTGVIATMMVVKPTIAAPVQLGASVPPAPQNRLSLCQIPPFQSPVTVEPVSNETRIADSTKLSALDKLLTQLKREGHRVLIYSQMTRMIDIIEDLMRLRGHTFIRLDGSSRLCDRRDMVAEFQSGHDLFAFLLSTRAGGLGINLTAADTVIFFDSDWNPTVDQQAMDRAHRLGQNKQVTVYRLVCRDTVEEKILFRAEEKRQMHRMVIAGADLTIDQMKPRDVASLLLEDDEMNIRLEQRRKQATGNRSLLRNCPGNEIDASYIHDIQMEHLINSPDEKSGTVTFSESALQKKRRIAWAGVTKGGGRPKKLKLLEPTINNGGVQIKRTPSTPANTILSEVIPDKKK